MTDFNFNKGWCALDNEKMQSLILQRDYHAFFVLWGLGSHCDNLGLCRPGIHRLRWLIGCTDTLVILALQRLSAHDWVREHRTINPVRRKVDYDYQLSPRVIHPLPEKLNEAWQLWGNAVELDIERYRKESKDFDTFCNNHQNHTQGTTPREPHPEPPPQPPPESTIPLERSGAIFGRMESNDKKTEQEQDRKDSQREAQPTAPQGATIPSPSSAPPPPGLGRTTFKHPLANPDLEALAHEVQTAAPTGLPQARELVYSYPDERLIRAGLLRLANTTNKTSPFGLLKSWLERGQILIEDAYIAPSHRRVSGDIDDMIER